MDVLCGIGGKGATPSGNEKSSTEELAPDPDKSVRFGMVSEAESEYTLLFPSFTVTRRGAGTAPAAASAALMSPPKSVSTLIMTGARGGPCFTGGNETLKSVVPHGVDSDAVSLSDPPGIEFGSTNVAS